MTWLTEGVIVALMGAASGGLTSLATLRMDWVKQQTEIPKIKAETDIIKQKADEELAKIRSERVKIELEAQNIRSERIEKQRRPIVNVLKDFNRDAFKTPEAWEDPALMLKAFNETRIQLQKQDISFDPAVGKEVDAMLTLLSEANREVSSRYPKVADVASSVKLEGGPGATRQKDEAQIGTEAFNGALKVLMEKREKIRVHLDTIQSKLSSFK